MISRSKVPGQSTVMSGSCGAAGWTSYNTTKSWIKKKSGVRVTDRSVHEHSSICRALHLMASYDQLNLPSFASAERLNRRRALIEMAHQGRPEAPSYEGADEILWVREAPDRTIVDPALTQHAAVDKLRKQKSSSKTGWRQRKREARPAERATRIRAPPRTGGSRRREGAVPQTAQLFSANQFSDEPVSRFGDFYPLPFPADDDGFVEVLRGLVFRRSRQRVGRRWALHRRKADAVRALNFLTGFKDESQWPFGCLNQAPMVRLLD